MIGEHPNNGKPTITDLDRFSDRIISREEARAYAVANNRHAFMEAYVARFLAEWDGED